MHTQDVQLLPQAPAVVFRVKTIDGSLPTPTLRDVGPGQTLAAGAKWRIVAACGNGGA
jgi:hypothetical protein